MASGLIIWINQRVHVATGKVGGQSHVTLSAQAWVPFVIFRGACNMTW